MLRRIFFDLHSSPFRSVLFMGAYAIVSFYYDIVKYRACARTCPIPLSAITSVASGEWRLTGSDASWYKLVADSVPKRTQGVVIIWIYRVIYCRNVPFYSMTYRRFYIYCKSSKISVS